MIYILKRLAALIPLVLVISFLSFELMHLAPGGPFDKGRAPASPEIERALKTKYHLDEPVWKQYLRYLGLLWEQSPAGKRRSVEGGFLEGDFGPSMQYPNHTGTGLLTQGR